MRNFNFNETSILNRLVLPRLITLIEQTVINQLRAEIDTGRVTALDWLGIISNYWSIQNYNWLGPMIRLIECISFWGLLSNTYVVFLKAYKNDKLQVQTLKAYVS